MMIWALDVGTNMGFAYGEPGQRPVSGAAALKQKHEPQAAAFWQLHRFAMEYWTTIKPDLVLVEAAPTPQAFQQMRNSGDTVEMTYGLHAHVASACFAMGNIRLEAATPGTIRKHFLGRANFGKRVLTKAAVVQRCRLLKYLPNDEGHDDNRADALAAWDYAAATFGGRRAHVGNFALFEQGP